MNLQERKELLVRLGQFMAGGDELWTLMKRKASVENQWFLPEFIDLAVNNIVNDFLRPEALEELIGRYGLGELKIVPKRVGIVMAGNVPLVGFHDLLCVFFSGHQAVIKPSSKDEVLIPFLVKKMGEWNANAKEVIEIAERLTGCDAYIATGSNNSSRYFEYYFRNHPHIIRKNRTSVAVLAGDETKEELDNLADDVYQFFGLGCRNVTKLYVPRDYDFVPLLDAFNKYHYLINHNKYKNNYDYNLALLILNRVKYMTNDSILLVEGETPFSRIGQLNYEYYDDVAAVRNALDATDSVQCVVSRKDVNFGRAQTPGICDYADGVDTMKFLIDIPYL